MLEQTLTLESTIMAARLIAVTQPVIPGVRTAEDLISYAARVSNPAQQMQTSNRLIKYCIKHKHWSIFEQASMTIEIKTTRAISAQILRHRTFTFQEFSQRYAEVAEKPVPQEARLQDTKNRQNSIITDDADLQDWWKAEQSAIYDANVKLYEEAIARGIAKESARMVLPMSSPTTLYMTGTVRSWIHYIDLRSSNGTQKEHMDIAIACKDIFKYQFPVTADALEWK
ncbi:thymidylate synthase [Paramecium bursaria Chlorella virus CVG-1]|nr:thymidylate synthase [Paramecium bursaria Chlorella virus CVG-1]